MTTQINLNQPTEPVAIQMVDIPAGSFTMGSPENEEGRFADEGPQHEVTLEAFQMSEAPITQAQWREVANWEPREGETWRMELNPDPSYHKGANLPVTDISWYEAQEFCSRLSQRTGKKFSLPSEAQWEYACRAGSTTRYNCGDEITAKDANFASGLGSPGKPTPVKSYRDNQWGLYDMHGNVLEWCQDDWHPTYVGAPTDGSAWID